ncbi:hypothetical protein FXO38_13812 [Capsicum annuum]|nr:hypothetical protein FXO38_13812 [Capsicum annuum]
MDGFTENTGVIVIDATNRPEILSQDLLRPGRYDRQVSIGVPNIKGRKDILKVYSNNKKLYKDMSLSVIAMRTPGFYGSDLANLMNETIILAGRRGKDKITLKENLPKSSISFFTHTVIQLEIEKKLVSLFVAVQVGYYVEVVDNEKNGLHQLNDGIVGKLKSVEVEMCDFLRQKDEIEKMLNGKESEIDLLRKKLGDVGDKIVNEKIV